MDAPSPVWLNRHSSTLSTLRLIKQKEKSEEESQGLIDGEVGFILLCLYVAMFVGTLLGVVLLFQNGD
jgi:hypothetical protein